MIDCNIVIHDALKKHWLHFKNPVEIIETRKIAEVVSKLKQVEERAYNEGLYAVGFISYEAASAFDPALKTRSLRSFPLLWFALFSEKSLINLEPEPDTLNLSYFSKWKPLRGRNEYNSAIARIRNYIREGDTYQVNYTIRLYSKFYKKPWAFFKELVQAQKADYAAFIDTQKFTICSASPELFFNYEKGKLTGRPMKGTAKRGLTLKDDKKQAAWLYNSEKNRAENLMIVDMIRNDFGRIAKTGSVKVPELYSIEKYPTLWQMTSTVEAETSGSISDVMKAIFPCASITGAPKVRTMEIISELETAPRGIYTGAIGFIMPEQRAQFNVAIRTVKIDKIIRRAEYGVGGGIVWDSTKQDEFDECRTKARVLVDRYPEFSLLESILWTPENGYFLLDYHLQRLKNSAEYFGYPLKLKEIRLRLDELAKSFKGHQQKVRLLVSSIGEAEYQSSEVCYNNNPLKLALADKSVDSGNPFLYHKTTNRKVYELYKTRFPDYDDVLLWNKNKEITESCTANVVVKMDGTLYTPPVESGLLAGTYRKYLLEQGTIKEKVIHIKELNKAEEIFLINSVRKWQKVSLTGY